MHSALGLVGAGDGAGGTRLYAPRLAGGGTHAERWEGITMSLNDESRLAADTPGGAPLAAERNGRVLVLTLNRPDKRNGLTPALHRLLHAAVIYAAQDTNIGAGVITCAGRAFCSRVDSGGRSDS